MDNPFQSPAIISFCPGILGIERGLERIGIKPSVVAYVEIEAFICANLIAGMEAGVLAPAPIWTDATTFDARPFRGRIHGITGGYPCPGESLAGLREGHLYKGFIWPSIRRSVAAAKPIWCFFENVDDHLTGTYPIVQRSLRNMGYATEAGIYSAKEAGSPQERERLFILAISAGFKSQVTSAAWGRWIESTISSHQLDHANSNGLQSQHEISTGRRGAIASSEEGLADTQIIGMERNGTEGEQVTDLQIGETISGRDSRRMAWPAGQGLFQYEWEEPRIIKPGLGCTINGYNFREDLLRAIGNSVVEQCAEIAFIDLLKKHSKK